MNSWMAAHQKPPCKIKSKIYLSLISFRDLHALTIMLSTFIAPITKLIGILGLSREWAWPSLPVLYFSIGSHFIISVKLAEWPEYISVYNYWCFYSLERKRRCGSPSRVSSNQTLSNSASLSASNSNKNTPKIAMPWWCWRASMNLSHLPRASACTLSATQPRHREPLYRSHAARVHSPQDPGCGQSAELLPQDTQPDPQDQRQHRRIVQALCRGGWLSLHRNQEREHFLIPTSLSQKSLISQRYHKALFDLPASAHRQMAFMITWGWDSLW